MSDKTFAIDLFDDAKMKKVLPKDVYNKIKQHLPLSTTETDVFAKKLIKWAFGRGATQYALWFQPLNGIAAEKHESFYSLDKNSAMTVKFGAKQLTVGEGDASSFPSGGMRQTFEARGVTKWDGMSYCFVKDGCLYIPSTFISPGGDTLDKKTPLNNSSLALNVQAQRILKLLGQKIERVFSVVGAEQEYFLINCDLYAARPDLAATGRTLFGSVEATPADHYYCALKDNVSDYMRDVDEQLTKLGIVAKTQHNEVAPCQHELAPCYIEVTRACDQNLLIMDVLKRTAAKHGLTCLLHEKPFAGVNGSGKHNNWSLSTESGKNLLEKGKTVQENALFLLLLSTIIKSVDEHQDLLRYAVSSASNDLRLGGNEAPPQTVSVFVGDRLQAVFDSITQGKFVVGKDSLDGVTPAATDRNRTSPVAFCQNKFEFRCVGSSANIADVNTIINTIVADGLCQIADRLENATDLYKEINAVVAEILQNHSRIIYTGDNYSAAWREEAHRRKLWDAEDITEVASVLTTAQNVSMFEQLGVLCSKELTALQQVFLEDYCKKLKTETAVLCQIVRRYVAPAIECYEQQLLSVSQNKRSSNLSDKAEQSTLQKLCVLQDSLADNLAEVEKRTQIAEEQIGIKLKARRYGEVRKAVEALSQTVNESEKLCPKNLWQLPSYEDIFNG